MTYLITQTFLLLLVAGLLGLILGWYLTRISATSARSTLQSRLTNAEADARELRTELDAAVTARGQAESAHQRIANELAEIKAGQAAGTDSGDLALTELQDALDACREQLAAATAPPEPVAAASASGAPIPKVSAAAAQAAAALSAGGAEPPVLESDRNDPDNLQRIKGIGPKIASTLNELGILRFEQIAAWSDENVAWINEHLRFKGRVEREQWIPQAKALLAEREASQN